MKYVTLHVLIPAWAPSTTGEPLLMLDDLKYSNDYLLLTKWSEVLYVILLPKWLYVLSSMVVIHGNSLIFIQTTELLNCI